MANSLQADWDRAFGTPTPPKKEEPKAAPKPTPKKTTAAKKPAAPKAAATPKPVGLVGTAAPTFNNRIYYEDAGAAPASAQSPYQQRFGGNDNYKVDEAAYQSIVSPRLEGVGGAVRGAPSAASSPYGLDDYGSAQRPSPIPDKSYFEGWRPEFMDAFNAGRQEDARRYTDLSGLSGVAGDRYNEWKNFLLEGTPKKDEYLHGYDALYDQFQGKYAEREKSADALFREQLGMLEGKFGDIQSSAAAQYAAQQARVNAAYGAAVPQINNAFQMAGGLADKANTQGQQGVADAIAAAGQMTPEQQKLMQAYQQVAGSKAIDGLKEVGQAPSYGVLAQPYLSDADLRQRSMTNSISDASASSSRAIQGQLAALMSGAYESQQGNLNDILFNGGKMFTNMLGARTDALSKFSNDYRATADSGFNMANETSRTQIDAMDRANQPSPYLQAMMKLTADAQQTDMGLRQDNDKTNFNGQVSMYNGDQANRADIINQSQKSAADNYASLLGFQSDNYKTDAQREWEKYGSDQTLAGVLGKAQIDAGADLSVAQIAAAARAAAGGGGGGGGGGARGGSGGRAGSVGGPGLLTDTGLQTTTTKPLAMTSREWRDHLIATGRSNQAAGVDEVGAIVAKAKANGDDLVVVNGKQVRVPNDVLYERALQTVLGKRKSLDPTIMRNHIKTVYMGGKSFGTKPITSTKVEKKTTRKSRVK